MPDTGYFRQSFDLPYYTNDNLLVNFNTAILSRLNPYNVSLILEHYTGIDQDCMAPYKVVTNIL